MSKKRKYIIIISAIIMVSGIIVDAIIENKWILFISFLGAINIVDQVEKTVEEKQNSKR